MCLLNYLGVSAALVILAGPKFHPGGYLAKVGPAPLRYKIPSVAPENVIPLPPLAMTNEPSISPPVTISTNEPPPLIAAPPAEPTPVPEPTPAIVVQPEPSPFFPQAFVHFFNQGGSNAPVSVIAPVPFTPPPASIPAPPSRATYQIK